MPWIFYLLHEFYVSGGFSRRTWKGACRKGKAGLTLWGGRQKKLQGMDFTWPGRIPCRSLSSLLQNVDCSYLKYNTENTEAGNARVQKHLVTAAKQIQTSILQCSRAKAGIRSKCKLSILDISSKCSSKVRPSSCLALLPVLLNWIQNPIAVAGLRLGSRRWKRRKPSQKCRQLWPEAAASREATCCCQWSATWHWRKWKSYKASQEGTFGFQLVWQPWAAMAPVCWNAGQRFHCQRDWPRRLGCWRDRSMGSAVCAARIRFQPLGGWRQDCQDNWGYRVLDRRQVWHQCVQPDDDASFLRMGFVACPAYRIWFWGLPQSIHGANSCREILLLLCSLICMPWQFGYILFPPLASITGGFCFWRPYRLRTM